MIAATQTRVRPVPWIHLWEWLSRSPVRKATVSLDCVRTRPGDCLVYPVWGSVCNRRLRCRTRCSVGREGSSVCAAPAADSSTWSRCGQLGTSAAATATRWCRPGRTRARKRLLAAAPPERQHRWDKLALRQRRLETASVRSPFPLHDFAYPGSIRLYFQRFATLSIEFHSNESYHQIQFNWNEEKRHSVHRNAS